MLAPRVPHPEGLPSALGALGRTLVMGVLNVTPDSFSDGGKYAAVADAIAHGIRLREHGADLVDVGGESTRPGASRIDPAVERARVLPVIDGLVAAGVPVSIDTMHASTAVAAVGAGAVLVNDVSGGLADPEMLPAVAELAVPVVLMHWRGHSAAMDDLARYADVVGEVCDELSLRVGAAEQAGVSAARIVIDPGLGFAKDAEHNWQLLRGLDRLALLGRPILVGASRKRFLGSLLADRGGVPRSVDERDVATDAITAVAADRGVWAVRVHDVRGSADAVRVVEAWHAGSGEHGKGSPA